MTAIEWLMSQLPLGFKMTIAEKLEEAREMEKQQIMDAYGKIKMFSEQYYNETYGSDEIKKAEEMGLYDKIELSNPNDSIFTSSQTEISETEEYTSCPICNGTSINGFCSTPNCAYSLYEPDKDDLEITPTSSQTISDEEIEKKAMDILKDKWSHLYPFGYPKKPFPINYQQDLAMVMLGIYKSQRMRFHCVPKEILDEEIEKEILHRPMTVLEERAFRSACKWYREQLKKK